MKAKCVKGNCGYEFENENTETFFETIDEGDVLFEVEKDTGGVRGHVHCPMCGAQCIENVNVTPYHEFKIYGLEAVEKIVKSGSGHSARINVPPSWQGKRVMVVRLE
jgi:hypothetical protein